MENAITRAAEWVGWPLESAQLDLIERFGRWLKEEGTTGGGLGPNEGERIESRHLADSLLFAGGWKRPHPPARLVDLGSGVGLPGLPLAILWPESETTLVDRSGRRTDLVRRAIRILGLDRVSVVQEEVGRFALSRSSEEVNMVVARALADPLRAMSWGRDLVSPDGVVVIGGSWREAPSPVMGEDILTVDPKVLDRPVWLRIMAAP